MHRERQPHRLLFRPERLCMRSEQGSRNTASAAARQWRCRSPPPPVVRWRPGCCEPMRPQAAGCATRRLSLGDGDLATARPGQIRVYIRVYSFSSSVSFISPGDGDLATARPGGRRACGGGLLHVAAHTDVFLPLPLSFPLPPPLTDIQSPLRHHW